MNKLQKNKKMNHRGHREIIIENTEGIFFSSRSEERKIILCDTPKSLCVLCG